MTNQLWQALQQRASQQRRPTLMSVFAFCSRVSFSADTLLTYKDSMRTHESYGVSYRLKPAYKSNQCCAISSAVLASDRCSQTIGWNQPMQSYGGSLRKETCTGRQAAGLD